MLQWQHPHTVRCCYTFVRLSTCPRDTLCDVHSCQKHQLLLGCWLVQQHATPLQQSKFLMQATHMQAKAPVCSVTSLLALHPSSTHPPKRAPAALGCTVRCRLCRWKLITHCLKGGLLLLLLLLPGCCCCWFMCRFLMMSCLCE